jgi:pullulanase
MNADILTQRQHTFLLWRAAAGPPPPALVIGQLQPGAPVSLVGEQSFDLAPSAQHPDLWMIPAADCQLADDEV